MRAQTLLASPGVAGRTVSTTWPDADFLIAILASATRLPERVAFVLSAGASAFAALSAAGRRNIGAQVALAPALIWCAVFGGGWMLAAVTLSARFLLAATRPPRHRAVNLLAVSLASGIFTGYAFLFFLPAFAAGACALSPSRRRDMARPAFAMLLGAPTVMALAAIGFAALVFHGDALSQTRDLHAEIAMARRALDASPWLLRHAGEAFAPWMLALPAMAMLSPAALFLALDPFTPAPVRRVSAAALLAPSSALAFASWASVAHDPALYMAMAAGVQAAALRMRRIEPVAARALLLAGLLAASTLGVADAALSAAERPLHRTVAQRPEHGSFPTARRTAVSQDERPWQ